jgi:aquaporin NIP
MSDGEQWRRPAAEAIGTFLLVIVGPGAAAVDRFLGHGTIGTVGVALAFFFGILLAIVSLAGISGAHINPAVTIALWSIGRHDRRSVISYVGAQCAGAMLAGLAIRVVVGDAAAAAATTPAIPVAAAFGVELVFSAILMWVIMRVTSDDRLPRALAPLAIAATVGALALEGGLTGSSMNPARSFGPAVATGVWTVHWLYWIAPIVGMAASAHVHELVMSRHGREVASTAPNPATGD